MGFLGKWAVRAWALVLAASAAALNPSTATAQPYPNRTINIITSVTAGSPFDLLARVFTERMRQKLGVPVILENVTGGQGLIATQRVLNAKSDGYTLTIGSAGIPTAPIVVKNAGYKAEDFVAITPLGQVPYILFVSSAVPATDIDSFMKYLKANLKDVNSGILTTSHLGMLLARKFGKVAGGELTEIGYRGSAEMTASLLSNNVQMTATTYSVAGPHVATGKIKAIGVVASERTQKMPDLPTFKEKGYPQLYTTIWEAMFAKADTPPEVLATLRKVSQEILSDPAFLTAMEPTGMEPWNVPLDQLQAVIDKDTQEFKADAVTYNIKFD